MILALTLDRTQWFLELIILAAIIGGLIKHLRRR